MHDYNVHLSFSEASTEFTKVALMKHEKAESKEEIEPPPKSDSHVLISGLIKWINANVYK